MKKCNKCSVCPFIQEGKIVKATSTNFKVDINSSVDCSTTNVIYLLGCDKCPQQYIGETERMLRDRFLEHKGYANTNNQTKATGCHFNQKGHSVSNMKITVIEKVFNNFENREKKCRKAE